jgi:DNA-directed RNA polymerase III subunit RPC1
MALKQQYRDDQAPKKISHVAFGLFDHHEIQQLSDVRIYSKEMYTAPDRRPAKFGPLDRRLVPSPPSLPPPLPSLP